MNTHSTLVCLIILNPCSTPLGYIITIIPTLYRQRNWQLQRLSNLLGHRVPKLRCMHLLYAYTYTLIFSELEIDLMLARPADTLPLTPYSQSFAFSLFFREGLMLTFFGLASDCNSPYSASQLAGTTCVKYQHTWASGVSIFWLCFLLNTSK
jgi:hypothetical protein